MAAPELRVLIVEDQEEARLLSAALLERHGLRVCGLARDGLEALARIRSERPDAVVLDLILPGLDGLGLLRALGRRDGGPVVVVTSQISDPAVSSLACRLGANYYYIKPVNFEELASLLRSICPGPRVRAARAMLEEMGAAGLDVVYTEPIRGDNPLLKAKNCIITPHISWAPKESRQRIMDCAVANVKAYQEGAPINVVNL